jgi:hypothetical protein
MVSLGVLIIAALSGTALRNSWAPPQRTDLTAAAAEPRSEQLP